MRVGWVIAVLLVVVGITMPGIESLLAADVNQKWAFETGGGVVSSPAVGPDGSIYVGSNDGHLYALRPGGTLKWKFETKGAVHSHPAVGADGTIYVGSWDHHLYAINPNGSLKWKFKTKAEVNSSPTIGADGTIYVGSWDHHLYAVDPNGNLKWMFATKDAVFSSPAVGPDGTVYIASWDHHLYALDIHSGRMAPRPTSAMREVAPTAKKPQPVEPRVPTPTKEIKGAEPRIATASKEPKPAVEAEKAPRPFKEIKAIDFDTTPAGEDMVVVTLNEVVQPRFFALDGGRPRLVCDFYGVYLGRGIPQRTKVNGNLIKQIRIGFYRGTKSKVRVVLDLEKDKKYEARQVLSQEKGRYIIIVKSLDRNR